jgi:hypothetical protein
LTLRPDQHRGEPVSFTGQLMEFRAVEDPEMPKELGPLWEGQLQLANGNRVCFYSSSPLPDGLRLRDGARVLGTFFKLYPAPPPTIPGKTIQTEVRTSRTPIPQLSAARLEPADIAGDSLSVSNHPMAFVFCLVLTIGIFLALRGRMQERMRRLNCFARRKDLRQAAQPSIFPRAKPFSGEAGNRRKDGRQRSGANRPPRTP